MDGTAAQQSRERLPTLLAHIAQFVLAIVILGLASYGVDYISYNVLIYSIAVNVCTLGVSSWLLASRIFLSKFDNVWVALGLHVWMLVFWIVDLGLTADLTREWSPQCSYTPEAGKICSTYVVKRDTTFKTYYGALIASSVLIGLQVLLWLGTTTLLALDIKRRRSTVTQSSTVAAGPRFSNESQTTVGDVEKTNVFDTVCQQPIRSTAAPLLPPSPEIESEPVVPFQPGQPSQEPSQYDPHPTSYQASILTESEQTELEWSGLDGIDSVGSPIPGAYVVNPLYFTRQERMEEARREVRQQDQAWWTGVTDNRR